jgi:sister chromatid cohesion protein PDS5
VAKNENLLNFVKERTLDKKFKIRKEALTGLAIIYKKHLSDPQNVPEATKRAVTWIKDKILHGSVFYIFQPVLVRIHNTSFSS